MKHPAFFCGAWEDLASLTSTLICFQEGSEHRGRVGGKNGKGGGWGEML